MISLLIFAVFVFLSCYNSGVMLTLQIQHYGIYRYVGSEGFREYIAANNRAATVPAVIPGMILLVVSILQVPLHPTFLGTSEAVLFLVLNLISLFSTFKWQRRLQSEMESVGKDAARIALLNTTNWIRTLSFLAQGVWAATVLVRALAIVAS